MHFQEFDISKLPSGKKATGWLEVASRADGGSWRLPLLYARGSATGPTLAVTAAVHGNEYEGVEAVPRIFDQVHPDALRGTLVMIAVCNMPAYEAGIRSSPIDDLNLARVFPGDAEGTITQRIAYWLTHRIIQPAAEAHPAAFRDAGPSGGKLGSSDRYFLGVCAVDRFLPRRLLGPGALGVSSLYRSYYKKNDNDNEANQDSLHG